MSQLSYSSRGGVTRFKCTVEGQLVVDLEVFGNKEIEYGQDSSGAGLQSLDSIKTLMTHLSSAIADSAAYISGKGLFDAAQWLPSDFRFRCPKCSQVSRAGAMPPAPKAWEQCTPST